MPLKQQGFSPFFFVCSYELLYKVTNSYNLIEYKYITETSLKRQTVPDVNRSKNVCLLKHCFTMLYTKSTCILFIVSFYLFPLPEAISCFRSMTYFNHCILEQTPLKDSNQKHNLFWTRNGAISSRLNNVMLLPLTDSLHGLN